MRKQSWVWMPHAGHFVGSRDCQFHLNTYVGGYIVSTVGECWPDDVVRRIHAKVHNPTWFKANQFLKGDYFDAVYKTEFGFEDVGYGRKYETMVFEAGPVGGCCPFRPTSWSDLEMGGYNDAEEARKGHMKMCEKYARMANKKAKQTP